MTHLTEKGFTVIFKGNEYAIQNRSEGIARAIKEKSAISTSKQHRDCIHIWHHHLGCRLPQGRLELQWLIWRPFKMTSCSASD